MTVASPGLSLNGNHANMTIMLIIQEAQPTLNWPCVATPWDSTVQGAEPKSDNNSNPSPNPMIVKAHNKTLRDLNSIDHSDFGSPSRMWKNVRFLHGVILLAIIRGWIKASYSVMPLRKKICYNKLLRKYVKTEDKTRNKRTSANSFSVSGCYIIDLIHLSLRILYASYAWYYRLQR